MFYKLIVLYYIELKIKPVPETQYSAYFRTDSYTGRAHSHCNFYHMLYNMVSLSVNPLWII